MTIFILLLAFLESVLYLSRISLYKIGGKAGQDKCIILERFRRVWVILGWHNDFGIAISFYYFGKLFII
jgi:hypothetical protein